MEKIEKHILVNKLNKITIKLKSYAFMKIFMVQTQPQKKVHKIRHYDLQLEGAEHISSWMKKKLQHIYLRGFLQIKDFVPQSISLKFTKEVPSPIVEKFNFKDHSIKSTDKLPSQIARESHQKMQKLSRETPQRIREKKVQPAKITFHKENAVQNPKVQLTHEDNKQSNMKILLDRVRKVNSQSKADKQNTQRNEKFYGSSFENRRTMSSNSAGYFNKIDDARSLEKLPQDQSPIRIDGKNHSKTCIYNNNEDMSFCKSGKTQRVGGSNYNLISGNIARMSQNYTPITYDFNMGQQPSMEMIDFISVKRWQRNQKRNIIMAKINALQKSLMNGEYPGEEMYFNSNNENYDDIYTARDYLRAPVNYSQGYLNMRATERPPLRSEMNVKIRK